jgi:hypothetical protein
VYQPKHATVHPGFEAKSIQAVGSSVVSPLECYEGHKKREAYIFIMNTAVFMQILCELYCVQTGKGRADTAMRGTNCQELWQTDRQTFHVMCCRKGVF